MFLGLFDNSLKKVGFEDVQSCITNKEKNLLINTLLINEQDCLILNTVKYDMEENIINDLVNNYQFKDKIIIIYGKNSTDTTVEKKYKQLTGIGFVNVYIYAGGIFEWMLLQDIYGKDEFPTTSRILDILKFKSARSLY
jgi:hypothetical protein